MFNYKLVIENEKGQHQHTFELEQGESKGGIRTISGKAANKVIKFGKLYIDEPSVGKTNGNKK